MFLITNVSGRALDISDLGLLLHEKQAVDLHKINLKIKPEESQNLKKAKKLGYIKVLKKDSPEKKKVVQESHHHEHFHNNKINSEELLTSIKSLIKKEISSLASENDKEDLLSQLDMRTGTEDNSDILEAIRDLRNEMKNQKPTVVYEKNDSVKEESDIIDDDNIDEETRVQIHQKTMDKRMKGKVKGNVEMQERIIIDSSLQNNISELENLNLE
ncbi:MAG: hypothetical protein ACOC5T_03055 [Elusimicrobiota bacterium]